MAVAFIETPRFPIVPLVWGDRYGPRSAAVVVTTPAGGRQAVVRSDQDLLTATLATGWLKTADRETLHAFLRAVRVNVIGFRVRDDSDCRANLQPLGVGDGTTRQWQLVKVYAAGAAQYVRRLRKPVAGTVAVFKDGVALGAGWSVDTTTGIVTVADTIEDAVYTASCAFDVPMAIDQDHYDMALPLQGRARVEDLKLREIPV